MTGWGMEGRLHGPSWTKKGWLKTGMISTLKKGAKMKEFRIFELPLFQSSLDVRETNCLTASSKETTIGHCKWCQISSIITMIHSFG